MHPRRARRGRPSLVLESFRRADPVEGIRLDLNPTTILVLLVGGVTVFIAFHNPVLGAAIVVGVAVVTLLAFLIKDNEERKRDGKKEEHKG